MTKRPETGGRNFPYYLYMERVRMKTWMVGTAAAFTLIAGLLTVDV